MEFRLPCINPSIWWFCMGNVECSFNFKHKLYGRFMMMNTTSENLQPNYNSPRPVKHLKVMLTHLSLVLHYSLRIVFILSRYLMIAACHCIVFANVSWPRYHGFDVCTTGTTAAAANTSDLNTTAASVGDGNSLLGPIIHIMAWTSNCTNKIL